MPGPSPAQPGSGVGNPELTFLRAVSAQTGLDTRVVATWADVEGAYAPNGTGHYNFLNLRPYPGDPYSGVSSGGFEQFASVQDAIAATVRRIQQPFAAGIEASAHDPNATPANELRAIGASRWDAGHYRDEHGVIGGALVADWNRHYPDAAIDAPASSSADPTGSIGKSPVGKAVSSLNPISGITSFLGDVWGVLGSPDTWIRVGLGLAGLAMIVVGARAAVA